MQLMLDELPPLIINAALTGMVPLRSDSPHVPLTVDEIIADAIRCVAAGATILHLHARESDGSPSYRREIYADIFAGVRAACPEVLISASCSGRLHKEFWQRSQVLDLQPDLASLTLGSLNFATEASCNSPQMIEQLALAMQERDILPECEIFDLGMAEYLHYLVKRGILRTPIYANLLLGSRGTISATADNLSLLVRTLPLHTTWAAAGIGRFQFAMNAMGVVMGGHVRVGLEDALYYNWQAKELATNLGLIERVVQLANAAGRPIATACQTRELLGLTGSAVVLPFTRPAAVRESQQRAA